MRYGCKYTFDNSDGSALRWLGIGGPRKVHLSQQGSQLFLYFIIDFLSRVIGFFTFLLILLLVLSLLLLFLGTGIFLGSRVCGGLGLLLRRLILLFFVLGSLDHLLRFLFHQLLFLLQYLFIELLLGSNLFLVAVADLGEVLTDLDVAELGLEVLALAEVRQAL